MAQQANEVFAGHGEVAALMRAKDWSQTAVGPVETWPNALKTVVRIMLGSRYAMWMGWGPELTFFYNDAYRPTLGAKHPWALGPPVREVWSEIWDALGPRIDQVLQKGEATWDEALLLFLERHGYSEETYHTFSYSPIPGDSGGVGGMLCVVTEETDRVIGERRLRVLRQIAAALGETRTPSEVLAAAQDCLSAHLHDAPFTLIYLLDAEGRHARLSASSGITIGHGAAPTLLELAGAGAAWPAGRVVETLEPALVEDLAARFSGLPSGPWKRPPDRALVLPIAQQGQTRPAGVFVAALNPHRPLDEEYRGFLNLLAGQIAAALANARAYEEERKRAEALAEIDRAKTAFFSNASHEFRTPLTLMLSPLEDLLGRGPERSGAVPVDRSELELIHRNGLRLLKLVNTLLDFSRIEAGRVHAVYEETDLAAYTAELASAFRSAMERAGLRFVVDCPPLPHPVHVDRDMWEKLVLNLVSNAFKYTLDGEVAVTLRPSADGHAAELTVRDTGVGIPAAELSRVFERFHRIEGQRGRTQEGTGIGLALVQELAKLHGGAVGVESSVGTGTRFLVTVPFGTSHLPRERIGAERSQSSTEIRAEAFIEEALRWLPGEQRSPAPEFDKELIGTTAAASAPGRRARVLLADDNADMRDYVRRLLAERYEVEAVPDGRAALEAAQREAPDLVVSDVMMPRLDGFGLVAALRADAALREVPIVLLSARAGEEAQIEGLAAGADDYLVKPFSARELLARVATNLKLAHMRREASEAIAEEARTLETLNRTGAAVAAQLDLDRLVQIVTDAGVELTGAEFGAFFYNLVNERGESYTLYSLSGAPRSAFETFPMPRNTAVFESTFRGAGVVRSDDIMADPRYGHSAPHYGMPKGHLPVRSYLAVPVVSRSGEVLGGLFFGHSKTGIFADRAERIMTGIAAQAAIAIDNARLYQAAVRAEQELRRLNETLEERVAAEIGQRQKAEDALRQAQKMEAIGQLTGGVAHDFNNLLTVITGNLDALQRRLPADEQNLSRLANAALRGANRAAVLTHRLLAFSRRQPLEPKPMDINKLVAGMSELLQRTLGEAVAVEAVLAGGLWQVSADANQLESAILNLAVNARDAMPDGGKLTIETANAHLDDAYVVLVEELEPGQYVVLSVSDTGTGMSPDVLAKAFEPFFTTKDVGHGTGLGLSQVYGFIKQSGGHARIYSEVGQGTTVKLYLPRQASGPGAEEDRLEPVSPPRSSGSETVLVVEDDPDVRRYTVELTQELGYRVLEAADGPTALRLLDRHREVDVLFTDVGLPGGMNGRQLADEAQRRSPRLKVLFTTGYARNAIVHHGRLDPGIELMTKPFTLGTLATKLRRVFDSR